ncbi:MAG: hypothetical protein Greene041679_26 [Parcubacteria group bacterium Greene0416_79]|nr:MAG: hypothetical protein Greene041679_26 [Parcubacteria group bacterium Greene0416_79]
MRLGKVCILLRMIDTHTLLLVLIAGIAIAILLGLHTEWRMSRLTRGKSGKSLEESVVQSASDIERFKQFRKEIETYLETVEKRLSKSIQGVATIRFDPFRGTGDGGRQSFASAFLDEQHNGVVISSIRTRERMSVFAKPIKEGVSEYELTGEEKAAIGHAVEKTKV